MRRPIIPALLVASTILLAGCAAETPPPSRSVSAQAGTGKTGTGELRTDLAPLTERFAELADAESAQWSSGTLGSAGDDDRVPGPSTYWIDAVVVLPQASYDALRAAHEYTESTGEPAVADALAASVPSGVFLVSDDLDERFAVGEGADAGGSEVYLSDATHSLVVTSTFE
jgi:hypothetical protein